MGRRAFAAMASQTSKGARALGTWSWRSRLFISSPPRSLLSDNALNKGSRLAFQLPSDATDRQIDQLVYELHGLTDEEIRTMEENV